MINRNSALPFSIDHILSSPIKHDRQQANDHIMSNSGPGLGLASNNNFAGQLQSNLFNEHLSMLAAASQHQQRQQQQQQQQHHHHHHPHQQQHDQLNSHQRDQQLQSQAALSSNQIQNHLLNSTSLVTAPTTAGNHVTENMIQDLHQNPQARQWLEQQQLMALLGQQQQQQALANAAASSINQSNGSQAHLLSYLMAYMLFQQQQQQQPHLSQPKQIETQQQLSHISRQLAPAPPITAPTSNQNTVNDDNNSLINLIQSNQLFEPLNNLTLANGIPTKDIANLFTNRNLIGNSRQNSRTNSQIDQYQNKHVNQYNHHQQHQHQQQTNQRFTPDSPASIDSSGSVSSATYSHQHGQYQDQQQSFENIYKDSNNNNNTFINQNTNQFNHLKRPARIDIGQRQSSSNIKNNRDYPVVSSVTSSTSCSSAASARSNKNTNNPNLISINNNNGDNINNNNNKNNEAKNKQQESTNDSDPLTALGSLSNFVTESLATTLDRDRCEATRTKLFKAARVNINEFSSFTESKLNSPGKSRTGAGVGGGPNGFTCGSKKSGSTEPAIERCSSVKSNTSNGNIANNNSHINTFDLISQQALKNSTLNSTLAKAPPELVNIQPAWVFCTRYSDRPSSGPRTRRLKSKEKRSKDSGSSNSNNTNNSSNNNNNRANNDEKRPRTAFTNEQLDRLRDEFSKDQYLNETRRKDLADQLNLNENQIKIWFQNKRAKQKKQNNQPNALRGLLVAGGLYNHSTANSDCSESYAYGNDDDEEDADADADDAQNDHDRIMGDVDGDDDEDEDDVEEHDDGDDHDVHNDDHDSNEHQNNNNNNNQLYHNHIDQVACSKYQTSSKHQDKDLKQLKEQVNLKRKLASKPTSNESDTKRCKLREQSHYNKQQHLDPATSYTPSSGSSSPLQSPSPNSSQLLRANSLAQNDTTNRTQRTQATGKADESDQVISVS